MTRLESLMNRREILINANLINYYTQNGNSKIAKYYKVMLAIRKEIAVIEHPIEFKIRQAIRLNLKSI